MFLGAPVPVLAPRKNQFFIIFIENNKKIGFCAAKMRLKRKGFSTTFIKHYISDKDYTFLYFRVL